MKKLELKSEQYWKNYRDEVDEFKKYPSVIDAWENYIKKKKVMEKRLHILDILK